MPDIWLCALLRAIAIVKLDSVLLWDKCSEVFGYLTQIIWLFNYLSQIIRIN